MCALISKQLKKGTYLLYTKKPEHSLGELQLTQMKILPFNISIIMLLKLPPQSLLCCW
jgi:hypothetical protein